MTMLNLFALDVLIVDSNAKTLNKGEGNFVLGIHCYVEVRWPHG